MNGNKKTQGAVSVFLVIILVPCIVVASVFVDISRVHLSKSVANSSADLALNSLMTNYDYDLSDWYGMVASCQNIEDFYTVSAEYFLRILSSQNLTDDEIVLISDYYAHATNDDTIYDLLKMESKTSVGEIIQSVPDANMSNATILKDQVVEFMKYRAPIELTTEIIHSLNSDSSVTEAIESKENLPLVEDKTAYYEAEGELLAAAFNSYRAIYDYYQSTVNNNFTNEKLIQYEKDLNHYKDVYTEIHNLMISNLYNTSGLSKYNRVTGNLDDYSYDKTDSSISRKAIVQKEIHETIYIQIETDKTDTKDTDTKDTDTNNTKDADTKDTDGSQKVKKVTKTHYVTKTYYYIDGPRITSFLNALETAIDNFKTAKNNYVHAASHLVNNLPGSGSSQSHAVQWWVQANNAVNSFSGMNHTANLKNAAQEMLNAYAKAVKIPECDLGNDIPSGWQERYDNLTYEAKQLQSQYLRSGVVDDGDSYLKLVRTLEEVSASNESKIKPYGVFITVDGKSKSIEEAIPYIMQKVNQINTELKEYIDLLTIAIDGNEGDITVSASNKVKKLEKLTVLSNEYKASLVKWTNTANGTYTTMANENQDEIDMIEQDCGEIDEGKVNILKTRLINIRTQLKTITTAIDSMKYGSKKIIEISDYNTFKILAQTKVSASQIKLTNQEVSSYAATTFDQLFTPLSTNIVTLSNTTDNNFNPAINPTNGSVETPELFIYFHNRFKDISKENVNNKKKELKDAIKIGKNLEKSAKGNGRYHGEGEEISKDFSSDNTFHLATGALSGTMNLIESLLALDVTNIRDDLYVTSYIMNMFSYATYENEGLYDLIDKKTEMTLANRESKYDAVRGTAVNSKGKWLSEALTDSYNKSLTNKMINKTNNTAYCAEVEYILFGKADTNNNKNVQAAYSNIYGIRYALNLVSGFKNFWTSTDGNTTAFAIDGIAKGIAAATGGVIPEPLTKVVLIPILTIFETAKDLDRLEAGFPVELFKTSYKEWWIRVDLSGEAGGYDTPVKNLTDKLDGAFAGPNKDKGLFYSDYLAVFVYLGLTDNNTAKAMYERMAEVIQSNMRNHIGADSYSMKNAQVYFKLNSQIRVEPLMITLPIFNDYDNNLDTKTDWCTFKISTVRGYS